MDYQAKTIDDCIKGLNTSREGLTDAEARKRLSAFGYNELTQKKEKGFFRRVLDAVKDPMLIILLFGFLITLGANIGKYIKTGEGDFTECFGILAAVILSVSITLIMEGSSKKAFTALKGIAGNIAVKVIRNGKTVFVSQRELVKGDVALIESGDKIVADGRLIGSESLSVDESALTGESHAVKKDASAVLAVNSHLAERINCVYSGTFVTGGRGAMVVTGTGDNTEIGKIAGELSADAPSDSPLSKKLGALGKSVTIVGAICALVVFVFSAVRLAFSGNLNFSNVSELFISCIVLIIAAVPEGLPTIVAVSLALNMIKLAKEKALIKKMIATETTGAVSVICSDKTGTLTKNAMTVVSVCGNDYCRDPKSVTKKVLVENFILNSTSERSSEKSKTFTGNGTEVALVSAAYKTGVTLDERKKYKTVFRVPFSSDKKYMITGVSGEKDCVYLKGAPEKVLALCKITEAQKNKLLSDIEVHQKNARRVLCFAHYSGNLKKEESEEKIYSFDGYCALFDPVREEVFDAVKDCKKAGIKIKMLTGDDKTTALAIAKELKIAEDHSQAVLATDLENLSEEELIKALDKITVIARSTPLIKLRVVKALKKSGEVVAVTGDGINDAPAIRHADVGIAMGKSGSEITKEAADVILTDDGFSSVVKAVSFGRNVYKNLQRFILFQLSVNIAALMFITASAIFGLETPFNTLQLLWINVIMDGPPALTLGLEPPSSSLMTLKPVKRTDGIVGRKTLLRILFNGVFVGAVMLWQYMYDFLGVKTGEEKSAAFTLFIFFQLFNAFNCRELGDKSIFKNIGKNKVMVATFTGVFIAHLFIVQVAYKPFGLSPMSFVTWLKCIFSAFSIIIVSELYKAVYRSIKRQKNRREKATFFPSINKNQSKA